MKIVVERSALIAALDRIVAVVPRANAKGIPILGNVRIEAAAPRSGGLISFVGTDMEMAIETSCPADVATPGALTTPAHTLREIVHQIAEGAQIGIEFVEADSRIRMRAGRASFSLGTLPAEDFPQIGADDYPHRFDIAAADLVALLDSTGYAMADDEARFYLCGTLLHMQPGPGKGHLRAVATDGHRLVRYQIALPDGAHGIPPVILPRKSVGTLARMLADFEGGIRVGLSDRRVRFDLGDTSFTTRLVDATFPAYEQLFPMDNDKVLSVSAKALAGALARVAVVSDDKTRIVKLDLAKGRAGLSATRDGVVAAQDEIDADYSGKALQASFNARYLRDAIEHAGERFVIALNDGVGACLVSNPDNDRVLTILMPYRA